MCRTRIKIFFSLCNGLRNSKENGAFESLFFKPEGFTSAELDPGPWVPGFSFPCTDMGQASKCVPIHSLLPREPREVVNGVVNAQEFASWLSPVLEQLFVLSVSGPCWALDRT